MAQTSVQEIIYAALRIAGVITAPGRGMSSSELSDGMEVINAMLDEWSADRLNVFCVQVGQYDLVPNQQVYTIGIDPAGLVIADFNAPRPTQIQEANIITQVGGGASPVRVSMALLNTDGWSQIAVQATGSTIPQAIYDDYNAPLSNLYLWPYPTAAAQLELYYWQQLTQFVNPTDSFAFPPGYRRAIEYNLAVDLANRFPNARMGATAIQIAMASKATIQAKNSPEPVSSCDPALLMGRRSNWNYLSDTFGPSGQN